MIGILGATSEEVNLLIGHLEHKKTTSYGMRDYHQGYLFGKEVVIAFSRWGKVAASTTTATMIHRFNIQNLIFTGVAGSLDQKAKQGDIVIGHTLYHHDLDGRPLFNQFETPLLHISAFKSCPHLTQKAFTSAQNFLKPLNKTAHQGIILSGDQFIASAQKVAELKTHFKDALAVEMEGAAVAQTCFEHEIPLTVIRSISDNACEDAPQDFQTFLKTTASPYAKAIIEDMFKQL